MEKLTGKVIEIGDLEHLEGSTIQEPAGLVILVPREQLFKFGHNLAFATVEISLADESAIPNP